MDRYALDKIEEGVLYFDVINRGDTSHCEDAKFIEHLPFLKISFVNKSFLKRSGYDFKELINLKPFPLDVSQTSSLPNLGVSLPFLSQHDNSVFALSASRVMKGEIVGDVCFNLLGKGSDGVSYIRTSFEFNKEENKVLWLINSSESHQEKHRFWVLKMLDTYGGLLCSIVEIPKDRKEMISHYVSKRWREEYGYPEEVAYKTTSTRYHNDSSTVFSWMDVVNRAENAQEDIDYEANIDYGGKVFPGKSTIRFMGSNPTTGNPVYLTFCTDLTYYKQLEDDVNRKKLEVEELTVFKAFFESPSDIIMGTLNLIENDSDIECGLFNPAAAKMMLARGIVDCSNFKQFKGKRMSQTCIAHELPNGIEYLKSCKDKTYFRHFRIDEHSEKCYSGWILKTGESSYSFIGHDSSEEFRLSEQLEREKENLEETVKTRTKDLEAALHVKSRFLATMSHEIRTPLSGIVGSLSLLTDTILSDQQQDFIQTAIVCGEQLLSLINDVLALRKMEENKLTIEKIAFSIVNAVEDAMDIVSSEAAQKRLDLICDIDPTVPDTVLGDVNRLRQILVNLLSNACKFSHKGEILVRIKSKDLDGDMCRVEFSVKDQGIGIQEDAKQFLFSPFTQADTSITRKYGGSGLGLYISKQLAEAMGGSINFDSSLGHGSVFHVTIIVQRKDSSASPVVVQHSNSGHSDSEYGISPPVKHNHDFNNKTIAVVDNNLTFLNVTQRKLKNWAFAVTTHLSGTYTPTMLVEELLKIKPDVIMVDWKDPNIDTATIVKFHDIAKIAVFVMGTITPNPNCFGMREIIALKKPIRHKTLYNQLVHAFSNHGGIKSEMNSNQCGYRKDNSIENYALESLEEVDSALKILVAEDNSMNQKIIRKMLESLQIINIKIVENGLEAYEELKQKTYDFVLMDLMMPVCGGIESTQLIRKDTKIEQPVIVAVTADALLESRSQCLDAGMNDVLTKPISVSQLKKMFLKHDPPQVVSTPSSPLSPKFVSRH